jgi:hypothetical protein
MTTDELFYFIFGMFNGAMLLFGILVLWGVIPV